VSEDTTVAETQTQSPDNSADVNVNGFETTAIPENYKASAVGKYSNVGELIKGYENAQKLIGAKGVIVPGEKATPEEWDKYYNALGRPSKPEEYKFSPVDNLHPELKMSPETELGFKALMHKHGISAKQADGLYREYFGLISQSLTKRDEQMLSQKQDAERKLRSEWLGDFDGNLAKIKGLIAKHGGKAEDFGDLGNNPAVLRVLANIAKKFSEDTFVRGGNTPSESEDAKRKLSDIMINREHPYWKQGPGHDDAVKEVNRLHELCFPNEREVTQS
jgi:hypothetical protein